MLIGTGNWSKMRSRSGGLNTSTTRLGWQQTDILGVALTGESIEREEEGQVSCESSEGDQPDTKNTWTSETAQPIPLPNLSTSRI